MDVENPQPPPPVGKHRRDLPPRIPRRPGEPEHSRLSAARLGATKRDPPTTLVDFWFRTRYIPALAARLSQQHPHVLELHLRPSTVASVIGSCVGLLPTFAQSWVKAAFPEWFLPSHVVLKKQKKGEGEEETIREEQFDTDVKAYDQLKPLQGTVIPTCYGRLRYDGTRALLLEYLGGVSMSLPEGTTLTLEELSALLQPCYEVLNAFSVHHDNPNLSNFQLVNGKIMALDLESAVFDMSADRRAYFLEKNILGLGL